MQTPTGRLLRAILAVHGGTEAEGLSAVERDFAHLLVAARRQDAAEGPCPDRARRRAHALLGRLPATLGQTLARLVFDSWRQAAPAARSLGGERLLRFENDVAAVDLQLDPDAGEGATSLALAVEGGGEGLRAQVTLDDREACAVALDAHGTGSLVVAGAPSRVIVHVLDEDGDLLETPPVALA